jgi:glutamate N-acetyltransferase/amino-acid N-acetyltransferase
MKVYHQAILPLGFKASGLSCGIKKSGKPDLALFYSGVAAKASGLFTANKIAAAPVLLSKSHLKKNKDFRAIIANSGNANCFTGKSGLDDAAKTASSLAKYLKIKKTSVLVSSTGLIGKRLPYFKIKQAMPDLVQKLSAQGIMQAKKAILTTDKFAKEITVKFNLGSSLVTICGIAKGAGMIAPDMATMLGFILSDANISQAVLNKSLKAAARDSFNCITVDGCMSTNDSLIILANGASKNKMIDKGSGLALFGQALKLVCLELAKMIVRDGEGATKFITIKVKQARNYQQAKKAALAVANSNLFKTAVYGKDPNFGRVVASVGASGVDVDEKTLRIKLGPLNKKDVQVQVSLGQGGSECTVYTSDLTPEYIKINAEYN